MNIAEIIAAHLVAQGLPFGFICTCGVALCDLNADPFNAESNGRVRAWAAHVAAELDKARTIRTVEELAALPVDAVVVAADEIIHERGSGRWFIPGLSDPVRVQEIPLPARILWLPTDETTT